MIDLRAEGFPLHFRKLRPQQEEVLRRLTESPHRVDVAALPTGTGKSLLAVAYARMTGLRTVILTSTRALQDQYQLDFPTPLTYDVKGMGNYPCRLLDRGMCDVGPCLDGESCIWKEAGCAYFDRVRLAALHPIVVTSYAFWFAHREDGALGRRELVILDEAHELGAELAGAAGMEFRKSELMLGGADWDLSQWRVWAADKMMRVEEAMEAPGVTMFDRRRLRSLRERLMRLRFAQDGTWAWDVVGDRLVRFEPMNLQAFTEPYLMRGAPKVLMMSATVRPDMMEELGIADAGFQEMDSPFPVERRPIYWLQTGVRMSAKSDESDLQWWARTIDHYIGPRLGKKGIVHTVSYARAKELMRRSEHRGYMMLHEPSEATVTVRRFKEAEAPAILVSPVVHTGHDFPYEAARWQVVAKVPFPDTRSGIAQARSAQDAQWAMKFAARTLVQMAGRVMRAEDDLGETAIVDDSVKWLVSRYKPLFPRWWRAAFKPMSEMPKVTW